MAALIARVARTCALAVIITMMAWSPGVMVVVVVVAVLRQTPPIVILRSKNR